MKVYVAGASGMLGTRLTKALRDRGDTVVTLPRRGTGSWALESADAVVNLAGASIGGKRWNAEWKKQILDSRVLTTRELVACMPRNAALINASAVGYYGGRGDEVLDESAPAGADFLAGVCQAWEAEAARAPARSVFLRTGIVLAREGGALQQMLPPFKAFVGGPIGDGKQWFPWIHVDDEIAAIVWAIDHASLQGAVNLVAPGIVRMKEFAQALGRALHRPALFPVPGGPLKLLLGEFAQALLEGQRAVPKKLVESGFVFRFGALDAALRDLLA
jgi:hypothetical protein